MKKFLSKHFGTLISIAFFALLFGGLFAYQYFSAETQKQEAQRRDSLIRYESFSDAPREEPPTVGASTTTSTYTTTTGFSPSKIPSLRKDIERLREIPNLKPTDIDKILMTHNITLHELRKISLEQGINVPELKEITRGTVEQDRKTHEKPEQDAGKASGLFQMPACPKSIAVPHESTVHHESFEQIKPRNLGEITKESYKQNNSQVKEPVEEE